MIETLLTNWWIYVPLAGTLLFLTYRNNQRIKGIKLDRELRSLDPIEREKRLYELKSQPKKFKSVSSKYGLSGVLGHIFPKR